MYWVCVKTDTELPSALNFTNPTYLLEHYHYAGNESHEDFRFKARMSLGDYLR